MKITVLMENTSASESLTAEHGLSFYIETAGHTLLLDTGASDATWANAAVLSCDPAKVDTVILSHGHYDHAGGLPGFLRLNDHARIWLRRGADGAFYHGEKYIGIDPGIAECARLHWIDETGVTRIDSELSLFSGITGRRLWPSGNRVLTERRDGAERQDEFLHEQCLVIREGKRNVLFSGCAHNGILNILARYRALYGGEPDAVLSGFHMMKKTEYTPEERSDIRETARELAGTGIRFYTGHCTGELPYLLMKETLGERLERLQCGCVFVL